VLKAFIGAAYGVHQDSGKFCTGCAIVLRESDSKFENSSKADPGIIISYLELQQTESHHSAESQIRHYQGYFQAARQNFC
jgi:hypothetical protein